MLNILYNTSGILKHPSPKANGIVSQFVKNLISDVNTKTKNDKCNTQETLLVSKLFSYKLIPYQYTYSTESYTRKLKQ